MSNLPHSNTIRPFNQSNMINSSNNSKQLYPPPPLPPNFHLRSIPPPPPPFIIPFNGSFQSPQRYNMNRPPYPFLPPPPGMPTLIGTYKFPSSLAIVPSEELYHIFLKVLNCRLNQIRTSIPLHELEKELKIDIRKSLPEKVSLESFIDQIKSLNTSFKFAFNPVTQEICYLTITDTIQSVIATQSKENDSSKMASSSHSSTHSPSLYLSVSQSQSDSIKPSNDHHRRREDTATGVCQMINDYLKNTKQLCTVELLYDQCVEWNINEKFLDKFEKFISDHIKVKCIEAVINKDGLVEYSPPSIGGYDRNEYSRDINRTPIHVDEEQYGHYHDQAHSSFSHPNHIPSRVEIEREFSELRNLGSLIAILKEMYKLIGNEDGIDIIDIGRCLDNICGGYFNYAYFNVNTLGDLMIHRVFIPIRDRSTKVHLNKLIHEAELITLNGVLVSLCYRHLCKYGELSMVQMIEYLIEDKAPALDKFYFLPPIEKEKEVKAVVKSYDVFSYNGATGMISLLDTEAFVVDLYRS